MKNTGIRTDIHPDTGPKPMKLERWVERGPIDALAVQKDREDVQDEITCTLTSEALRKLLEKYRPVGGRIHIEHEGAIDQQKLARSRFLDSYRRSVSACTGLPERYIFPDSEKANQDENALNRYVRMLESGTPK